MRVRPEARPSSVGWTEIFLSKTSSQVGLGDYGVCFAAGIRGFLGGDGVVVIGRGLTLDEVRVAGLIG